MKRNKIMKIASILFILILLLAINTEVLGWSEIIQSGQDFIDAADDSVVNVSVDNLQETSGYLYNILLAAGIVIAVIVATILGIQFMTGGAEGQAKVKEMLIPFVVGCIVVFGGFAIWKLAVTIGERFDEAAYVHEITEEETKILLAIK